jgi:RHS repeat-associated protein
MMCRGRAVVVMATLGLLVWASRAAAQTETIEYYGTDAVGSVRIVFNASGAVLARQDYGPFGQEILSASGMSPERFGGQTADSEVQQAYFHARQFQSRVGRFASADPVFANPGNPQRWNRYGYALGNPLRYFDEFGLEAVPIDDPGHGKTPTCVLNGGCTTPPTDGCGAPLGGVWHPTSCAGDPGDPQVPGGQTGGQTGVGQTPPPTSPPSPNPNPPSCQAARPVSVATWFGAASDVYTMTTAWALGVGPTNYDFGPRSAISQEMANAHGLQEKIDDFLAGTGPASGLVDFGAAGLLGSGMNSAGQFVGSYGYELSLDEGEVLNVTLTNTTTAWSFFYHAPVFDPKPPTRSGWRPMGRVNQTFHLIIQCSSRQ